MDHLERFAHERYLVRRKFLKLFGGAFHVYDGDGELAFYSKMKAFKLKEDIRLYTGEDMQEEVLTIQARSIIDFSAAYDVIDPVLGDKIGALRRKGMKSMLRDEWLLLDEQDREIGTISEDSWVKALLRRFVDFAALLMPQQYQVTMDGQPISTFRQQWNPFIFKLNVDFSMDPQIQLDRRLGLAAAMLMAAIEGRQD